MMRSRVDPRYKARVLQLDCISMVQERMVVESKSPDSPLPINCANLSLSALNSDFEPIQGTNDALAINSEPLLSNAKTGKNGSVELQHEKESSNSNPLNSLDDCSPEVKASIFKRRSSLVSQNPPTKVHKRKLNWESGKLSVLYAAEKDSHYTFSLSLLQNFILDVLRCKSRSSNDVFSVNLYGKVKNMTVAFVSGFQNTDLEMLPTCKNKNVLTLSRPDKTNLPFIYDNFHFVISLSLPADKEDLVSPITALLKVNLSYKEKLKRAAENKKLNLVLFDLLLTETEMRDNNYPIHSLIDNSEENALPEGWVETKPFDHDGSHTFAVDCEFCDTASGKVLTRISIVNFQSEVVYDTYVKPDEKITNYQTRYSGITEEILEGVTTTLEEVQSKVLSIVSSSDILIGHSLESDLRVMRLRHPRVIDSALTYEHHKGFPQKPGLRWLSEQYLKRLIQQGEATGNGHSSIEDLIASLDLIKMKLVSGPDFGRNVDVSLFSEGLKNNPDLRARVIDSGFPLYNSILKNCKPVSIVSADDDEAVVNNFKDGISDYFFNLVWLRDIKRCTNSPMASEPPTEAAENESQQPTDPSKLRDSLLSKTNANLQQIFDSLPSGSIFVVCSDGGDTQELQRLNSIRREFQKQVRAGVEVGDMTGEVWDIEKKDKLKLAIQEARKGFALIAVKD